MNQKICNQNQCVYFMFLCYTWNDIKLLLKRSRHFKTILTINNKDELWKKENIPFELNY